jgi:hypothetical protein
MNKPFAITPTLASAIADAMSKLAETHPNDVIANQYARTAEKLEEFGSPGSPCAPALDKIDIMTIQVFVKNHM